MLLAIADSRWVSADMPEPEIRNTENSDMGGPLAGRARGARAADRRHQHVDPAGREGGGGFVLHRVDGGFPFLEIEIDTVAVDRYRRTCLVFDLVLDRSRDL